MYILYTHTVQMSSLPNWFSIYTVRCLVFLFMIFIFWKIFPLLLEMIKSPGWAKFQFIPWIMKNTKLANFYSPHRHGSIAERLVVIVFKHSGL